MNQYKNLKLQIDQALLTVSLNRPQTLNAISPDLMDDLSALCDELNETRDIHAVILTGNGKAFSSGLDLNIFMQLLSDWTQDDLRVMIRRWQETFNKLEALPQITIAAVNGVAFGGGVVLALACDFRIASARAFFGLPEIKLGMVLALGGTQRLTRLIGVSAAKEMILRGRNVTAIDAQHMGLVHRICEPGDLAGLARSWAERQLDYSPRAIALAKRLIDQSFDRSADESAEAEMAAQVELLHSPEFVGWLKSVKENGEL